MDWITANEIMKHPEFNSKFTCLLKHFLERENITQEQLGKKLGMTRQGVNVWFQRRAIKNIKIMAITSLFNISYTNLAKHLIDDDLSDVLEWMCLEYERSTNESSDG